MNILRRPLHAVVLLAAFSLVVPVLRGPAVYAESPEEAPADSEFVGIWKVKDGRDRVFYITIRADGTAVSQWAEKELQSRAQQGTWKLVDGGAMVVWDNGWREMISAKDGAFVKRAYSPRHAMDSAPSNETIAEKVDAIPGA